jgi:hypothetical protein
MGYGGTILIPGHHTGSPGRPCTSKTNENVEKIEQIVRIDRRLSILMIAEMVNIDKETVRQVLHDKSLC